jgi:hypothetical protein
MRNGRGWKITRGTAAGLGVLGGLGGLGLTYFLAVIWFAYAAGAAVYPRPGDQAVVGLLLGATLFCLVAALFDLTGAVVAWRKGGYSAAALYAFAGGAFAVVGALTIWTWATAMRGDVFVGRLGIAGVGLALVTPWWSRWAPQ